METEEIKNLLQENLEISQESLKILRGIRKANRLSNIFKVFYWLIIIGSAASAYYYLQPYLQGLMNIFQQTQEAIPETKNISSKANQQIIPPDLLKNPPSDILKGLQSIFKPQ